MFAASGNKLFTKSVTALGTLAGKEITSLLLTKREISTETNAIMMEQISHHLMVQTPLRKYT